MRIKAGSEPLKVQRLLGTGSYKKAYQLKHFPDLAILVGDRGQLLREAGMLKELAKRRIPALKTYGVFKVKVGRKECDGLVVPLMVASNRDRRLGKFVDAMTKRSLLDLKRIRRRLEDLRLGISDLQFLISSTGRVVVADPLDIQPGGSPDYELFNFLADSANAKRGWAA